MSVGACAFALYGYLASSWLKFLRVICSASQVISWVRLPGTKANSLHSSFWQLPSFVVFKAQALNRPSATKCHAAFAMLQQLQRGDSRARALNTTKDSYAALRVHFQGDRAGVI